MPTRYCIIRGMEKKELKLYISKELHSRLKAFAKSEMRSVNNTAGYIIKQFLDSEQK